MGVLDVSLNFIRHCRALLLDAADGFVDARTEPPDEAEDDDDQDQEPADDDVHEGEDVDRPGAVVFDVRVVVNNPLVVVHGPGGADDYKCIIGLKVVNWVE